MRRILKTGAAVLAALMLLTGCGESGSGESGSEESSEILYPVSINGKEILLGETTVQTLLDEGFSITVSEMSPDKKITQYEIDPNTELEPDSYYSGMSIWITDSVFAHISMVTDSKLAGFGESGAEKTYRLGDAIIARLEFSLISADEATMNNITFNNTPLSELDRDRAGEMFPDFTATDTAMFQYGLDYEYSLTFSAQDKSMTGLSLSKKYDVDWNSN